MYNKTIANAKIAIANAICKIIKVSVSVISLAFGSADNAYLDLDNSAYHTVLPFSKSKFLIFVIEISLNSLDCIRYFLENSLKFH
jgi:hypothetical protein